MSVTLEKSETHRNLLRAFAGESQARNRYTFAAGQARKEGLQVIERAFLFTAEQERAHAKVFYGYLEPLCGKNISIGGSYPVDLYPGVLEQLRAAQHNEYQEWEHDYADFAKTAEEEGFSDIARTFRMIASIEQTHGDRFGRFADLLEKEQLFCSEAEVQWTCLNCGFVVTSTAAPASCPVCRHPQGYFVRVELAPWA